MIKNNFNHFRCVFFYLLIITTFTSTAVSADSWAHRESVIIYADVGFSFPDGDHSKKYKRAFHGGTGIGFVISHATPISSELVVRLDFHHFPKKKNNQTILFETSDDETSLSLEGRFRFETKKWFRPYITIGLGIYDLSGLHLIGAGVDFSVTKNRLYMLYIEIRQMDANRDQLRLDFGIRLG